MENFSINSILHFREEEYQLRTSRNGRMNKIVCSLFRNAEFVSSKEIDYSEERESKLLALIKKFHEERKSEIEFLFNLSQKLENTGSAELINMLGLIFVRHNLHVEAIKEFLKATRLNPGNSITYNNLGKALLSLKKYEHAIKAFNKAIELNPNYADLYNNLGTAYLETEACKNAVQQFDKAINLNPYFAEAYLNRGLAYILNKIKKEDFALSRNYREEVQKSFEKAIQINPSYQNKHYHAGLEYLEGENLQKAFEELKIVQNTGTRTSYLYDKYDYYIKLLFCDEDNRYEMIGSYIKFLQSLLKKYPGHADIHNDLGLAYCILRNYINERAIKSFENALDINPNFEEAQRNLKLSKYEKIGSEIFLKAITVNGQEDENKQRQKEQEVNTVWVQ